MKVTIIPIMIGAFGSYQRLIKETNPAEKETGRLGGRRTSKDHPNYNIIENGQDTEKSPEDLRRLVVTQTPVKDNQLKLMRKTLKE